MKRKPTITTPKRAITRNRDWAEPFLLSLAQSGNVSVACSEAAIGRDVAYDRRRSDPEFAAKWKDSLEEAADLLECEARRRAEKGVEEPVIYQGTVAGNWFDADGQPCKPTAPGATFIPITIRKYSDTLLIFLLKATRPKKFRESIRMQHGGKIEQAVTVAIKPAMSRLMGNPEAYAAARALKDRITSNDN